MHPLSLRPSLRRENIWDDMQAIFDRLGRVPGFNTAHVHVMTSHGEYAPGKQVQGGERHHKTWDKNGVLDDTCMHFAC